MARRPIYTDEQRAEAVALYQQVGATEAANRLGIKAGTIKAWASQRGVTTVGAEVTKAATEMSKARRAYVAEEFRTQMVESLAVIATEAVEAELAAIRSGEASLEKIVGARTRAIHDLRLLEDLPTSRVGFTPERQALVDEAREKARHLAAVPDG